MSDKAPLLATDDPRPVHLVGIAGAGMSALAELLARRGVAVTGCDVNPDGAADVRRLGVRVERGHSEEHVRGCRAVIATSAVSRTHPELEAARAAGIPVHRRADALGLVVHGANVVGVSGTHGKTTTTALVTHALAAAGLDPTALAGGRVAAWHGNLRRGGDHLYVVEADEYDRSFLALAPTIAAVTNVEADHLDIYGDISEIRWAFEQFIAPARFVVACADDRAASTLRMPSAAEVIRYGIDSPDARLRATTVKAAPGDTSFSVVYDGADLGPVTLAVPGRHNVLNALCAVGCGIALGAKVDAMRDGIAAFRGVERRFQVLGTARGVTVVDDYAHHPTEIAATLEAARAQFPGTRIVAAFQPHLFSRTRDFANEFAAALAAADEVFLTEIYPSREQSVPGVTSTLIADALARNANAPAWRGERAQLADALERGVREGDTVVLMGAGDITRSARELIERLAAPR